MELEHKDHLEKCPECGKHYLCREVVCRLVCAKCEEVLLNRDNLPSRK